MINFHDIAKEKIKEFNPNFNALLYYENFKQTRASPNQI